MVYITRGFEGGDYRVEPTAVKDILDLAEDVPYNVQALSSVAWELLGDEDGEALTPKLVRRDLRLLVERDSPFYLTVWNGLTTVQQRVLAATIHERGVAMTSAAVAQRYRITPSTMSKTLKLLEAKQILASRHAVLACAHGSPSASSTMAQRVCPMKMCAS
ncbi:MAG: helix-turn-helix domain-containing protein [Steroidobacteraceae bacterium]